jgi:hypothetical protein
MLQNLDSQFIYYHLIQIFELMKRTVTLSTHNHLVHNYVN